MADTLIDLLQELQDLVAKLEAIGFGGDTESVTHNGVTRASVAKQIRDSYDSIQSMVEGQIPYTTLALATAAGEPPLDSNGYHKLVRVLNDTTVDNNGFYYWNGSALVKSPYDPVTSIKNEMSEMLSGLSIIKLGDEYFDSGILSLATGGFGTSDNRVNVSSAVTAQGILTQIGMYVYSVGSGVIYFELFEGSLSSYTRVLSIELLVSSTGVVELISGKDFDPVKVDSNLRIGIRTPEGGARVALVSGGSYYYFSGDPGDVTNTYIPSGQTLQLNCRVVSRVSDDIYNKILDVKLRDEEVNSMLTNGWIYNTYKAPNETSAYATALNRTYVNPGNSKSSGFIKAIRANVKTIGNGSLVFIIANKISHPATYQEVFRIELLVKSTGWNEWNVGTHFEPIKIGFDNYFGIFSNSSGPSLWMTTSGGSYFSVGDLAGAEFTGTGQNTPIDIEVDIYSDFVGSVNPWVNKKIFFIGDSITYQNLFTRSFLQETGMINAGLDGVVGRLLQNMADNLISGDLDNVDIVLCGTGVNNWHHSGTTKGVFGDLVTDNTFFGAVRNIVEKVYALNPSAQVVFWGPINSGEYAPGDPGYGDANTGGLTISDVTDAMREAARAWGCPFFATQEICTVNPINIASMMPDNLHPNQEFADYIGASIGKFINSLVTK